MLLLRFVDFIGCGCLNLCLLILVLVCVAGFGFLVGGWWVVGSG